jgi:hypothetical protein
MISRIRRTVSLFKFGRISYDLEELNDGKNILVSLQCLWTTNFSVRQWQWQWSCGTILDRLTSERLPARFRLGAEPKTFLFPLPLLPHQLMSYFDVGRHLSFHEKSAQDIAATKTTARPAHMEKRRCYHNSLLERSGKRRVLPCN